MEKIITIRKRKFKNLPDKIRDILPLLEEDLRQTRGKPYNRGWKNLGPIPELGNNVLHCHLSYRFVAVWETVETDKKVIVKIRYCGTRENAPY